MVELADSVVSDTATAVLELVSAVARACTMTGWEATRTALCPAAAAVPDPAEAAEARAGTAAVPRVAAHRVMVRARFRAALSLGLRCEGNAYSFLFARLPG